MPWIIAFHTRFPAWSYLVSVRIDFCRCTCHPLLLPPYGSISSSPSVDPSLSNAEDGGDKAQVSVLKGCPPTAANSLVWKPTRNALFASGVGPFGVRFKLRTLMVGTAVGSGSEGCKQAGLLVLPHPTAPTSPKQGFCMGPTHTCQGAPCNVSPGNSRFW